MEKTITKSTCRNCHGGCGTLVTKENDKVIEVTGDPDHPINAGKLCVKAGQVSIDQLYHPDRVNSPLIRTGERGAGEWREASWDEALSYVAKKLNSYKENFGAESVVFARGVGMNNQHIISRVANLFGTPNLASISYVCYATRVAVTQATATGTFAGKIWDTVAVADLCGEPKCIVEWGSQKRTSNDHGLIGFKFLTDALKSKPMHIVVDPRKPASAGPTDIWLPIRPSTDAAMALGWINLIIEEDLYDHEFVNGYTHGFHELRERAKAYTLKKVSEITWCDPELIAHAARNYAKTKPACILWGNGLDHGGLNAFQSSRAVICLMGLTGNIDNKGGNVFFPAPKLNYPDLKEKLGSTQELKRLGGQRFKALNRAGFAHPPTVFQTILSEKPYPVKALVCVGSNLVTTYPNTRKVIEALKKLDLLVVHDMFMTPTAQIADVVLPACGNLERDEPRLHLHIKGPKGTYLDTVSTKLAQVGLRKSDWEFMIELGQKLGFSEYFPSLKEMSDEALKPSGIDWDQLKELGQLELPLEYEKYKKDGFGTPSGKFEFLSNQLKTWGYDPLPNHTEPSESPISTPELYKEFPLILITGIKESNYYHSQGRQISTLRKISPEPRVDIHYKTASSLGISHNDKVCIETPNGKLVMKASIVENMLPQVVCIPHGWWIPERAGPDHGVMDVCANVLTDDNPDNCDPYFGSSPLKGILCRLTLNGK